MTIDEAIEFCNEKSKNIKLRTEPKTFEQLAEWLEDYKRLKSIPEHNYYNCHNLTCRRKCEKGGYNKAIDDFANACKENILCQTFGLHPKSIDDIAKKLKDGGGE